MSCKTSFIFVSVFLLISRINHNSNRNTRYISINTLVGDRTKLMDLIFLVQRFTNGRIIKFSEARHGCNDEDRHVRHVRQTDWRYWSGELGMSSFMFFYPVFCFLLVFFRVFCFVFFSCKENPKNKLETDIVLESLGCPLLCF